MKFVLSVTDEARLEKARAEGEGKATLVCAAPYEEGDVLRLTSEGPCYIVVLMEDSMAESFAYLDGEFTLPVPFGEKRVSYSPKSFTGELHLLWVREATAAEIAARRNLALCPIDSHHNVGLYPHAHANVETRGESVFAARNAIDGCYANTDHGPWPYQSWGINRQEDAEITIEFGRAVRIDELVFTLRADFPHDNWWRQATVTFSDGTEFVPQFIKTGDRQSFPIEPRTVCWLKVGQLLKDESDPSPFPALTQLEAWGTEQ